MRDDWWWMEEVAEAVDEKEEVWGYREDQPDAVLLHSYGQKKKAAKIAVDITRK